jgi:tetraacyldisaccharide 4'-kinase
MSGEARGASAAMLRALLSAAEPFYAAAASARNWTFDTGLRRSHRVAPPVISVGNLTTGGTGKTPVVRWLAQRLREAGRHVAVVARGYGARLGELGDEQLMLSRLLNDKGDSNRVTVVANPDRVVAVRNLLHDTPGVDAIVLDDGFQHRRLARDFDILLLNAANPWGYGHVLPRGMLRESVRGIARAGAIILTHSDQAPGHQLNAIENTIRRYNATAPIYRAVHTLSSVRVAKDDTPHPIDDLRGRAWFAVSGVADPGRFIDQLRSAAGRCAGHRAFPDHHAYTDADLAAVRRDAEAANAEVIVTTEKDWAKLQAMPAARAGSLPIWRVDVSIQFLGEGEEQRLWDQVWDTVSRHRG